MIYTLYHVVDLLEESSKFWMQAMIENGIEPNQINKIKDSFKSLMETSQFEKEVFGSPGGFGSGS